MSTEIQERCNTIEACYEFTLSFAAQGLPSDQGSESGKQVRHHLGRAVDSMRGLEESCSEAISEGQLEPSGPYRAFFAVLAQDAQNSIAAVELVLAQPSISSQLIDSLNASIHLRALLADLFLVTEILELRQMHAVETAQE